MKKFFIALVALAGMSSELSAAADQNPSDFYCTADAWRVYVDPAQVKDSTGEAVGGPKEFRRVNIVEGTNEIVEASLGNKENDGKGVLVQLKPSSNKKEADAGLLRARAVLKFDGDYAVRISAVGMSSTKPNPDFHGIHFLFDLVSVENKKVRKFLGRERAEYPSAKTNDFFDVDLSNLDVDNAYLQIGSNSYEDSFKKILAKAIKDKKIVPDGSIWGTIVSCTPVAKP